MEMHYHRQVWVCRRWNRISKVLQEEKPDWQTNILYRLKRMRMYNQGIDWIVYYEYDNGIE